MNFLRLLSKLGRAEWEQAEDQRVFSRRHFLLSGPAAMAAFWTVRGISPDVSLRTRLDFTWTPVHLRLLNITTLKMAMEFTPEFGRSCKIGDTVTVKKPLRFVGGNNSLRFERG